MRTFVFAGPSAVGKTYIAELLMKLYPNSFEQAKLYTTRKPRQNETPTDRIFISLEEFVKLAQQGKFIVHEEFGGNYYGFDHNSLYPKDKHLLVNAWPWLIPQFSALTHTVIVGMQAPKDWKNLLVTRMERRGDTQETIQKRLKLIAKDNADMELHKKIVQKHGNFFIIQNDKTIPEEILPWLKTFFDE